MDLIVQKYGGAILSSVSSIRRVAQKIANQRRDHRDIIAVVSAMGKTTDQLLGLASELSAQPAAREVDMLLTAGERISMALLAMALKEEGIAALSLTGSQSGIITDNRHGEAHIREIRPVRILKEIQEGKVVIVAGFQGVSEQKEITTLGRGGSDTTAVALSAVLQARYCEFYKDVEGVYNKNPKRDRDALKFEKMTYQAAIDLSQEGEFVLHRRAIYLAKQYSIPLYIRSGFSEIPGTWIRDEFVARVPLSVPLECEVSL